MKYEEGDYQSSSASWLLSFVLGGLVGAAVALLLAPRSGRQTREQIKDIAEDAKEKAGGYYGQMRDKVSTAMQKGSEMFQQKKSEIQSAMGQEKEVQEKPTAPRSNPEVVRALTDKIYSKQPGARGFFCCLQLSASVAPSRRAAEPPFNKRKIVKQKKHPWLRRSLYDEVRGACNYRG